MTAETAALYEADDLLVALASRSGFTAVLAEEAWRREPPRPAMMPPRPSQRELRRAEAVFAPAKPVAPWRPNPARGS